MASVADSSQSSGTSTSQRKAWEEEVGKILARIFARRDSELFREPVPFAELGLTDYLSVVQTPMDLGTVRSKLESHKYNSEAECAEDMRLIWHNAMLYNAPGALVYVKAKALSEYFETQWASFCAIDHNRPPTTQELQGFAENCYRISADDLGQILALLEKESPTCLIKKPHSNEVEINVDLINGRVFRAVSHFVDALLDAD